MPRVQAHGVSPSASQSSATALARPADGHSNLEIYVMGKDGSAQTRLTFTATQNMFPAWSPNGRRIAFSRGVPADLPNN